MRTTILRPMWTHESYPGVTPDAVDAPAYEQEARFPDALAVLLFRDGRYVYGYRFWGTGHAQRAAACQAQWESGASWTEQELYQ